MDINYLNLIIESFISLIVVAFLFGQIKQKSIQNSNEINEVKFQLNERSKIINELHNTYVTHRHLDQVVAQLKEERESMKQDLRDLRTDVKEIIKILSKK